MDYCFPIPTVSNELPPMTNLPAYPDFTVTLSGSNWRQAEFVNISKLKTVGEEVDEIKEIHINHSREMADGFRAFHHVHVRRSIGAPGLFIPLFELRSFLNSDTLGAIAIDGHPGFVKNGFAIASRGGCYYGTEANGIVKSLALCDANDRANYEVPRIVRHFSLIFVDWCDCRIITP